MKGETITLIHRVKAGEDPGGGIIWNISEEQVDDVLIQDGGQSNLTDGIRPDDILTAKTRLAALSGTVVTLSWRGLPGEYEGRLSLGAWEDKWTGDHQIATLVQATIDAHPCLIGRTITAALKTGATTIHAKGNRPCWPTWTIAPANGAKTISVKDAHGHTLAIAGMTAITGRITIITDPDKRELRVNGNLMAPTLESDYFPLLPGLNTLTLTGATSASLTYRPLTLI